MIKCSSLFSSYPEHIKPLFEGVLYPWEILPKIGDYISALLKNPPKDFYEIEPGVLAHRDVKIGNNVTIMSPAVLGKGTEVRQGAYIRGNVITGNNCVIGNSSEIKNSVLLDRVQVPHYNYVGDSVLGNYAHLGAGSILSNLKLGGKCVIIHADTDYDTGLRKVGSFLGDYADIGCSSVLNPGTVVGKGARIYPLVALRGVISENVIVKSDGKTYAKRD